MKISGVKILVLLFLFLPLQSFSQWVINLGAGISNFDTHRSANENLPEEWKKQESVTAFRFGIERKFKVNKFSLGTGLVTNLYGADHVTFSNWRLYYCGITLGVQYPIKNLILGIRTTPSILLANTLMLGFDPEKTYNFDLEPNLTLDLAKGWQVTGGLSYGLNPAIKYYNGANYSNFAYIAGVNYIFNSKS
ncbi:hypothetical protein [Portibacter lacus]|uniref:Outer membrane protein beta-barrel domain-containing protein n=1 Tax=Portibacter lacus TaxID=1099794 RepID=A0AA37SS76_9BACT|nr:hypothetical protein [Portibacter lacus]GLR17238.1 hypothetical protein GCM10007940_18530 [Portibacter lacus]